MTHIDVGKRQKERCWTDETLYLRTGDVSLAFLMMVVVVAAAIFVDVDGEVVVATTFTLERGEDSNWEK